MYLTPPSTLGLSADNTAGASTLALPFWSGSAFLKWISWLAKCIAVQFALGVVSESTAGYISEESKEEDTIQVNPYWTPPWVNSQSIATV